MSILFMSMLISLQLEEEKKNHKISGWSRAGAVQKLELRRSRAGTGDATATTSGLGDDLGGGFGYSVKQVWSTNRCVLSTFFRLNSSFSELKKKRVTNQATDGRTDGLTDGQTLL